MLNDNNSFNQDNRNLIDVFKELQNMQNPSQMSMPEDLNIQKNNISKKQKKSKSNSNTTAYLQSNLKLSHIIVGCSILLITILLMFSKNLLSSKESYASSSNITSASSSEYELNRHRLNMQSIISENSGIDRVKEQVTEARTVEFETTYNNNSTLPKGEEIVKQEGINGTDNVTVVKTYENGIFIEEIILDKKTATEPTQKLVDVGTSEFLAKHKVHIGDTLYLLNDSSLKETADDSAKDVAQVKKSLDVKLIELPSEEWCKVSYDGIEGYIKTSGLTSPTVTPNIIEKNRIQKILLKLNKDITLNTVSGLTLNDYKKVFTGLPNDTNKIFQDNYEVFYNIEKKYNINGIFLASMAIHESAWGTSQIAQDKHNLFGYGSYDSSPYDSSYEFDSYSECIETVAKSLVKYYLNPPGTVIYDGELASGSYYNSPTLSGVNTRYASDQSWHEKVYSYMEMLYNRL